jgi:hypothetical protein
MPVDLNDDDFLGSDLEPLEDLPALAENADMAAEAKAEVKAEVKEVEPAAELNEAKAPEEVKEAKRPVDLFADEKKTDRTPFLIVAGAFGLAVVLLVLARAKFWDYSTAVYFSGLTFIPVLLWLGRKTNTVYVALLGCVIAVLMTSIVFLWWSWAKYEFDIRAADVKQRIGMVRPADYGWPTGIRADAIRTFDEC